jgi:broad specificity phosphatase PhoE
MPELTEAALIDAANDLAALIESDTPKYQAQRDKALRNASLKIQKLTRRRFRAQRKAVLDSHALANLKSVLDRSGHLQESESSQAVRRVTGSVDVPLTDEGRKQAYELRDRIGSDVAVFTAPNSRSRETGQIVNQDAQDAQWLRPWSLGRYEGMTLDAARELTNKLVLETPDQSPGVSRYSGKEGDSFNAVAGRLIAGTVAQRAMMKPGARVLNITSGRALHIIHAAARNGFQSVDKEELVGNSEGFSKPGHLFALGSSLGLYRIPDEVDSVAAEPGQFFAQHGETDWNEGVATSEALREAEDPDRARLEADIAATLSTHVYTVPVTAEEQNTFARAIAVAIDSGGEAAGDMLASAAPDTESFIAEYLKDGGFSRLTGDLDKTTVDDLASAVADAYESGADFDGVVQAVKDSFQMANDYRAKLIAQTELNDAFNQSVFHFGKEAGATQKSWTTDLAPCLICIANEAQGVIDIDEDFESGDDAPPAHPQCMCSLLVHA